MNSDGPKVSYDFKRVRAVRSTAIDLKATEGAEETRVLPARDEGGRLPRVTRLLALAHRFSDLLASGEVASMAELARVGRVTRARLSQIADLTLLAPDIQEEILSFGPVERGRDPVSMRALLTVAHLAAWSEQRQRWRVLGERLESP